MKTWYRNIAEFVQALERAGELKRIKSRVSPYLEMSRLTDRESKAPGGGRALYFEQVEGSPYPAATNLFGSLKRISMGLGVDHPDDLGSRLRSLLDLSPPRSLRDARRLIPTMVSMAGFLPRRHRGRAPCQEVILKGDSVDLERLPVLHCWPGDGGAYITLPLVFTKSLVSEKRNLGMYRMQVFDRSTTGMHWHPHKDGAHFFREYRRAGRRMPVAVALGADPATTYAATAPLPRNVDELLLAGFIRGHNVPMTRCVTIDLEVPAEAEFVLEGYVDPGELCREGPFGDHTGYYSLPEDYPVFHVTAVTHRRRPLYCATVVGPPPMEDAYLGLVTERLFLPLLQTLLPEVKDHWLPFEGVFHNMVVVAVEKSYPGQVQKVIHGLWGHGQMSLAKGIIVVDTDTPLRDPGHLISLMLERLDPETDLIRAEGPLDVLEHASPAPMLGGKVGVDLSKRLPGEPARNTLPDGMMRTASPARDEALKLIRDRVPGVLEAKSWDGPLNAWNGLVLLRVERGPGRNTSYYEERLFELDAARVLNILILFDPGVDLSDHPRLIWRACSNVDAGRDIRVSGRSVLVDACTKGPWDGHLREWPEELSFTPGD